MKLNLEIDKIIELIKKKKLKTLLLQLPDGLKPKADEIASKIKKNTGCNVLIWLNSCYGACDVPNKESIKKRFEVDDVIQLGHAEWK